jgi:hypothetical protein
MRTKLSVLLGCLLGFCALFCLAVSLQPARYEVVRTKMVTAPPRPIFDQVNTLRKWPAWSPWSTLDPNMKESYEGPPSGVGAKYSWDGNSDVGAGQMTITESDPNRKIKIKLEYTKPFVETKDAEFTFLPEGQQTVVTWSLSGQSHFFAKAYGLFRSVDTMVGGDFEKGLDRLKAISEAIK